LRKNDQTSTYLKIYLEAKRQLLKTTYKDLARLSWLGHNRRIWSSSKGKIQGKSHPRNNYITQTCRDIEMQTYAELKRIVECHDQKTSKPVFGLANLMMMCKNSGVP